MLSTSFKLRWFLAGTASTCLCLAALYNSPLFSQNQPTQPASPALPRPIES